ncbi:hypothetical protein HOY80DRAFT_1076069 [Tuber brumale]|nr:hypothetical protein HOY80DRAFT_1076069 [Tuber brumale]
MVIYGEDPPVIPRGIKMVELCLIYTPIFTAMSHSTTLALSPRDPVVISQQYWLKAVIRRARGSRVVAQVELMSSTSHEVCGLRSEESIVWAMNSPEIAGILYFVMGQTGRMDLGYSHSRLQ